MRLDHHIQLAQLYYGNLIIDFNRLFEFVYSQYDIYLYHGFDFVLLLQLYGVLWVSSEEQSSFYN